MSEAEKRKPILCLDFDGVLHSYSSGWKGADVIPDPPVKGALQFIYDALHAGFDVQIYSSRSHQSNGIGAMERWLELECEAELGGTATAFILGLVKWPEYKPSAMVTIDDRAITFTGEWPDLGELLTFKPWNKA